MPADKETRGVGEAVGRTPIAKDQPGVVTGRQVILTGEGVRSLSYLGNSCQLLD